MSSHPLNWIIRLEANWFYTRKNKYKTAPPFRSLEFSSILEITVWRTNEVLLYWPETKPPTVTGEIRWLWGLWSLAGSHGWALMTAATPSQAREDSAQRLLLIFLRIIFIHWESPFRTLLTFSWMNSLTLHHKIFLEIFSNSLPDQRGSLKIKCWVIIICGDNFQLGKLRIKVHTATGRPLDFISSPGFDSKH